MIDDLDRLIVFLDERGTEGILLLYLLGLVLRWHVLGWVHARQERETQWWKQFALDLLGKAGRAIGAGERMRS